GAVRVKPSAGRRRSLRERFDVELADFNVAAFALDADFAGGEGAGGAFVHQLAVDVDLDVIAGAKHFDEVPFTDGFFDGGAAFGDGSVGAHALMFLALGAGHADQVALGLVFSLALVAGGPEFVAGGHVNEDAGVIGFGGDLEETPFDGEFVIAVILLGPHVADGFARVVDDAVFHRPGFGDIVAGLGEEQLPTCEIPAIEEIDARGGRNDTGSIGGEDR